MTISAEDINEFVETPKTSVRRALSVLQLREMGYQFDEIAEILDIEGGEMEARRRFEQGLVAHLKESPAAISQTRQLTSRRLERLLRAVWTQAIDPKSPNQIAAQTRALAIIDRHARLFGLDAPTEISIQTPTRDALEQWAATVTGGGVLDLEEADVIEAKAIEA